MTVFRSRDFRVVEGVNEGDCLSDARDLALDDVYTLFADAAPVRIAFDPDRAGKLRLAADTRAGRPGAALHVDSRLTFMEVTGATREALVLVELDETGHVAEVYLHPLAPFPRQNRLVLIRILHATGIEPAMLPALRSASDRGAPGPVAHV